VDICFYIQDFSVRSTHFEFSVLLEKLGFATSFHFLLFGECNEAPDSCSMLVLIPRARFVFLQTAGRCEKPIAKPQYLYSFVRPVSLLPLTLWYPSYSRAVRCAVSLDISTADKTRIISHCLHTLHIIMKNDY
jgi:hypothetical protein